MPATTPHPKLAGAGWPATRSATRDVQTAEEDCPTTATDHAEVRRERMAPRQSEGPYARAEHSASRTAIYTSTAPVAQATAASRPAPSSISIESPTAAIAERVEGHARLRPSRWSSER